MNENCTVCWLSARETKERLDHNATMRADANGALKEAGLEYQGKIDEDAGDEDAEIYIQFIDPLDAQLRKLFDDMTSDRYEFQHDTDLPFMAIVKRYGRAIPFRTLLETINRTHQKGV